MEYFQPAGDINTLKMFPISFEEFIAVFKQYEYYGNWKNEIIDHKILKWLEKAFDVYSKIGGYPLAVSAFLDGNSFADVEKIHQQILDMLFNELRVRMGSFEDYEKLNSVLFSVINIMMREKKGDSGLIEHISKVTENHNSFRVSVHECYSLTAWLKEAGFLEFCGKMKLPERTLQQNERIFFADLGMFRYLCKRMHIASGAVDGLVCENFVFKSLNERNFPAEFYGFGPSFGVMDNYEIDFYVDSLDECRYGVEVKSGRNAGKSAEIMKDRNVIDYIVYFKGDCNYGLAGRVVTVPLCMAYKFRYDFGGMKAKEELSTVAALTAFDGL